MKKALIFFSVCFSCLMIQAQGLHWVPIDEGLYSGSTTVIAVIQINSVEQTTDQLEVAVFSGDECRGTAMTGEFPITHRFLAQINVYGENGHVLTFKAYDHRTNQEMEMDPEVTVTFTEDGSGTLFAPMELNFSAPPQGLEISLTPGWNWISYLLLTEKPLSVVFINLTPSDGDMIKGQDGFSTYNAATQQWSGSISVMKPGRGYMYMNAGTQIKSFSYPIVE